MGSRKAQISQEAFDSVVQENVEEFDMSLEDALEDAVQTFELQGANLEGINTSGDKTEKPESHPVVTASLNLQSAVECFNGERRGEGGNVGREIGAKESTREDTPHLRDAIQGLQAALQDSGQEEVNLALKSGALHAAVTACGELVKTDGVKDSLLSLLELIQLLLTEDKGRQIFYKTYGPEAVLACLRSFSDQPAVMQRSAEVAAAGATKFELTKEKFMDAKAHVMLIEALQKYPSNATLVQGACEALRSLSTADDARVAASKAFANARNIAEKGAVPVILAAATVNKEAPPVLAYLCAALKAIAVNDEICRQVAEEGGIQLSLAVLKRSAEIRDKAVAKTSCMLLAQLAGNDGNKEGIAAEGGFEVLCSVMATFSSDPAILQECMAAMGALTLRSPENAARACHAGAADAAAEAMEENPEAGSMLRQACMMIRNLAVRNPENRPLLLEKGLEALLRRARADHLQCKDVGAAALRDLGFDNYND